MTVGQPKPVDGERATKRAENTRLADARLAGEDDALAGFDGVDELVDEALL